MTNSERSGRCSKARHLFLSSVEDLRSSAFIRWKIALQKMRCVKVRSKGFGTSSPVSQWLRVKKKSDATQGRAVRSYELLNVSNQNVQKLQGRYLRKVEVVGDIVLADKSVEEIVDKPVDNVNNSAGNPLRK